ncbi:ATP-binding cassette domain-containing protein [Pedobacter chinensis]|uniref:ATP-binding cassette domain-containing protein n=1 Tax=Pedobacter chinensis TaxID=2282421 RepID=A0A369PZ24_9SPHI|nr:ATP-binding cassette domain-containing protein [Pedobacter chinensis]RDC57951.1 ATP-binding cassette domain-containing protein [Pedobacter chinensis]
MIKLNAVNKSFCDTQAVKDVSFEVSEGENLILLGTSGCGKTTTLKMINRLIVPDSGSISIDGKDIANEQTEKLRRGIGYVLQNIGLFPHYTVAENIAVVPKLLGWNKEKIKSRSTEILEKLHLPGKYSSMFPNELSGGQQQRVGLARALVTDPAVLLMDEPFGALDNITRLSIRKEFKALEELKRKTIVMVTHDIHEAFDLADRICLMDQGTIIQIGTPKELLYHPVNEFARNFLASERLSLEFKMISLNDIWDLLPNLKSDGNASISSTESIWDAMEKLQSQQENKLTVNGQSNEQKTIDFNALTTAFNHYQNNQYHE